MGCALSVRLRDRKKDHRRISIAFTCCVLWRGVLRSVLCLYEYMGPSSRRAQPVYKAVLTEQYERKARTEALLPTNLSHRRASNAQMSSRMVQSFLLVRIHIMQGLRNSKADPSVQPHINFPVNFPSVIEHSVVFHKLSFPRSVDEQLTLLRTRTADRRTISTCDERSLSIEHAIQPMRTSCLELGVCHSLQVKI